MEIVSKTNGHSQDVELKKFAIRFVILSVLLFALLNWTPDAFFGPLNRFTASSAGFLLTILSRSPVVQGIIISLKGFSVRIITECSAIFVITLFLSFVVACPATIKQKSIGLFFGIPVLFLFNTFRIVLVTMAGDLYPDLFKYIHVYLGQIFMIVIVFISCMIWLLYVLKINLDDSILGFLIRFTAFSSKPFLLWIYLNTRYVLIGDYIIQYIFSLANHPLKFSLGHEIYYHTFNLITFTSLVFATRSIGKGYKTVGIIIGIGILSFTHLLFRICNVFITGFNAESVFRISTLITIMSQYILPVILWLLILYFDMVRELTPRNGQEAY